MERREGFFFARIRLDAVQGKRHETACVLKNVLSLRILRKMSILDTVF